MYFLAKVRVFSNPGPRMVGWCACHSDGPGISISLLLSFGLALGFIALGGGPPPMRCSSLLPGSSFLLFFYCRPLSRMSRCRPIMMTVCWLSLDGGILWRLFFRLLWSLSFAPLATWYSIGDLYCVTWG